MGLISRVSSRTYRLSNVLVSKTEMGVDRKVIQPGSGACPPNGSKVQVHYVGTLTNGKEFDSSRKRGRPFEFVIGQGQVIKGWDHGVAQMQVGEKSLLTCSPDFAYGDRGFPGLIPAGSTLVFEVELLGFK